MLGDPARKATLAQLRFLSAVEEHGGFTAAALALGVTQSTVSHAIVQLETALGARLLERGRHGARPTPLGRRTVAHARSALAAVAALEQEAALERGVLRGVLRVAAVRSAATLLLPPAIRRFRESHPEAAFELLDLDREPGGIEGALLEGRADVGVLSLPVAEGLRAWEILRDEYLLLWPREQRRDAPSWEEIAARPFVLGNGDCTRRLRDHWERCGQTLRASSTVREDSVMISMVEHRLGVGALPALAAHPLPRGVRAYPLPEKLVRALGVALTPTSLASPLARAFVDELTSSRSNSLPLNSAKWH